jgi:hypothetical protein
MQSRPVASVAEPALAGGVVTRSPPACRFQARDIAAVDDGARCTHGFEPLAKLLGDALGIEGIPDDLRPYEDDDLRAHAVLGGIAEDVAQIFDHVEARYAGLVAVLLLADETAEQHGLAARHRNRRVNATLRSVIRRDG